MRPASVLSVLAFVALPAVAAAQTPSCEQAWQERNAIYKAAGYCFKTPKAVAAFGNAGCKYDEIRDLPLSDRERETVAEIVKFEGRNHCTATLANGETFPAISLRIELSAAALKKLVENGEMVNVEATYYGNSRRADGDQTPGDVPLGIHAFDVSAEAANVTTIPAPTFDRRLTDKVFDRTPRVTIRARSSRKVFIYNLLECGMPQDSVVELAKETVAMPCKLIGERS